MAHLEWTVGVEMTHIHRLPEEEVFDHHSSDKDDNERYRSHGSSYCTGLITK